ncbi:tyrosine-type recombinase/integrase [Pseudoalteromonas sp. NBT06-2]|uniref:tyrosine-type recombinase/integrase n=1 Tax=Pseudoalteromonas sp. NBT06-2 TaxID=2025950 RepID=UPI001BB00140|nr:tyrosine-type recombinase/integrase [Pseudoalteromonas sp. NBT06-2]
MQNTLLQHFARFAEQKGETIVRTESVIKWAGMAPSVVQKRNRLLTVRRFALAVQSENDQYEIPPADVFGHECAKRKIRHLFSSEDIRGLLVAASQLKPKGTIRPITYTTLFALLSSTGLRSCEAIRLNIDDLTIDGLMIRATKFRKDRLVPIHSSTRQALKEYLNKRKQCSALESAFFVSNNGSRLTYSTIISIYLQLMRHIGLRTKIGIPGPCLHDLRHSFAVRSLEQCGGTRIEISRQITALSTYMGHAHVSDTYWYLQSTPY